ncbi:hypothetical protein BO443_90040 [Burkholderia orbicola]
MNILREYIANLRTIKIGKISRVVL